MKCRICGGAMESRITDLPFKLADTAIVIVQATPVFQCCQCGENELEHSAMQHQEAVEFIAGFEA
jgi:YgiT-type zinc finger domain-containing protein